MQPLILGYWLSAFLIHEATAADLPRIREIIALSFPYFGVFADHSVSNLSEPVLVSEADGVVMGFVKLTEFKVGDVKCGCILWIAVHPLYRRKGVALGLTCQGVRCLKASGAQLIFASTQQRNVGARTTLSKAGFIQVGFLGLMRLFGWRVFNFYREMWYAPGEIILLHGVYC